MSKHFDIEACADAFDSADAEGSHESLYDWSRRWGAALLDAYEKRDAEAVMRLARIEILEKDLADAAGELMLPLPEPGSDMAKVVIANKLLRDQNYEVLRPDLSRKTPSCRSAQRLRLGGTVPGAGRDGGWGVSRKPIHLVRPWADKSWPEETQSTPAIASSEQAGGRRASAPTGASCSFRRRLGWRGKAQVIGR